MIDFQMKYLKAITYAESSDLVRWNKTFIFDENSTKLGFPVNPSHKFSVFMTSFDFLD